MVKITEECSAAILKKKDPGCPTISCSIGPEHFENTLCDLRATVSVMPNVVFDKLNYISLSPTTMCLQVADQSVCYPVGVVEDIPVRVRDFFVPVDFVVLDMDVDTRMPLILGRPFLSTTNANIDVEPERSASTSMESKNGSPLNQRWSNAHRYKWSIEKILTLSGG
jgi:hypothetical protein